MRQGVPGRWSRRKPADFALAQALGEHGAKGLEYLSQRDPLCGYRVVPDESQESMTAKSGQSKSRLKYHRKTASFWDAADLAQCARLALQIHKSAQMSALLDALQLLKHFLACIAQGRRSGRFSTSVTTRAGMWVAVTPRTLIDSRILRAKRSAFVPSRIKHSCRSYGASKELSATTTRICSNVTVWAARSTRRDADDPGRHDAVPSHSRSQIPEQLH